MELNDYQRLANRTDQQPLTGPLRECTDSLMVPLLGISVEASKITEEHKKWLRDGESYRKFPDRVAEELGDLLWYLSNLATKHGLTLEDIAARNLRKTARRWPHTAGIPTERTLFDNDCPAEERLPRRMDVHIQEESGMAITTIDGENFGDPLTDNRYEDDGYRFHDISHIAHAAILGWSPTLRALLGRKRKSNAQAALVEDSRHAIAIEEGISATVFSYAERRNFLEGTQAVDYELLRTLKEMTSHLEVTARTEGEWEKTIIAWLAVWRHVKANGHGRIHADLETGTLDILP